MGEARSKGIIQTKLNQWENCIVSKASAFLKVEKGVSKQYFLRIAICEKATAVLKGKKLYDQIKVDYEEAYGAVPEEYL